MRRRRPKRGKVEPPPGLEYPTDAVRSTERPPRGEAPDPEESARLRFRRRAAGFVLGAVFVAGLLAAFFGDRGLLDVFRSRGELRELEQQAAVQRQRVAVLKREVVRLQNDPAAVERIAREDLGLVRPGEIVFLLPREEGGPLAGPGSEVVP